LGISGSAGTLTSVSGFAIGSNNATSNSIINTVLAGTANTVPLNIVNNLGTVTLNGLNTYTGKSIISSGSVIVNSTSSLGIGGSIVLTGGWLVYGTNIAPTGGNAPDFSNRFSTTDSDQKFNIDTNGNSVTFNTALVTTDSGGHTSGIDKRGVGTLTLNGSVNNTFYNTTVEGGTLQVGTGGTTGSLGSANGSAYVVTLHGNGVLAFNRSNAVTLAATITGDGTGGLTQMGTNVLSLTATQNYIGVTSVLSGTLKEATTGLVGVLATSSVLSVTGGIFDLNGHTQTLAGVTLTGGTIGDTATNHGTLTSTIPFVTGGGVINALLNGASGSVGLTQSGTGNTVLNQQNIYHGLTSITAGTLTIGIDYAISNTTGSLASVVSLGANNGTLTGSGVLALNPNNGTLNKNLTLGSLTLYAGSITGGFNTNGTNNTTGGTITNIGPAAFNFYGGEVDASLVSSVGILKNSGTVSTNYGVLTLNGNNSSLNGTTTLTGGTLILGNAGALGSTSIVYTGTNNTTIMYAPGITTDLSTVIAPSNGLRNIVIDTGSANTVNFNTAITQTGTTTLTKAGAGTLVLGTPNTFTGTTTVNGGTLLVGGGTVTVTDALASGTLAISNGVLDLASNSLTKPGLVYLGGVVTSGTVSSVTSGTITSAGGVLNSSLGFDLVAGLINAPLVGVSNATINKHGAGNVIVTSDLSGFHGNIAYSLSAGSITVGTGGTTGVLPNTLISTGTSAAYLTFNRSDSVTYAGTLTGNLALTQAGSGILTLTQLNTNSGGTNLNNGILVIGASNALGTGIIAFNGGSLTLFDGFDYSPWFSSAANQAFNINLHNQAVIFHAPVTSAGGNLNLYGGGSVTLMSDNNTYGALSIGTGVTVLLGGGSTIGLTGSLGAASITDSGLIAFNRTAPLTVATAITGSGGIEQREAGVTTLTGTNTYAGTTTITKGTLTVGDGTTNGQLGSGAILNNSTASTGHLTFNRSDAVNVASTVTGNLALTQAGTGNTTLNGAANYTGPTSISAGTLTYGGGVASSIQGVSGTGVLKVASGSTLTSDGIKMPTGALSVAGSMQIRSNGSNNGVSKISTLTLAGSTGAWSSKLDLTNNLMVVEATSSNKSAQLSTIRNQVSYGKTHTTGIVSTTITSSTAIAVVDNGTLPTPKTALQGVSVGSNSILVTQALAGDTDLSGKVDFTDLTALLRGYNTSQAGRTWQTGNFTGSGSFADLTALLRNYNQNFGTFGLAAGGGSDVASTGVVSQSLSSSAPVPEPTSLALIGLGAAALLTRRKRKI
jgi:autotransporter-associated beta strand protein